MDRREVLQSGVRAAAGALLLCLILFSGPDVDFAAATEAVEHLPCRGMARLTAADDIVLDMRYTTAQNVSGRPIETGGDFVCLQPLAADKIKQAALILRKLHPGYRLVIFDGLRTRAQQQELWTMVKGTDPAKYVADPMIGSIHSFGFAVDLSIRDENGLNLDMGTDFDAFTPLAEPRRESAFRKTGRLTAAQIANRHLLRRIMVEAGFQPLAIEWWHFDTLPAQLVRSRYRQIP